MAEAAVTPVVERCVGVGLDAAIKHLGYIWNYKKNIKNLQTQVQKLDEERADKSTSVTVAVNNVEHIKDRVKGWQKNADEFSEDAKKIIQDHEEEGKKRCLMGLCPSLVSRYQLSKRASEKESEIVKAITDAEKFIQVSDRATGLGKKIALSTKDCFTFESRKSLLEKIVKTLQDETMNCVGVYGLGGMGKTTLAKQIASQVTQEKMFEEVVFASVTRKVDMKEVQGHIAGSLDLQLEDSTVIERASRIHERLKGKKVLVVLDDLWTELELIQVGIPFGEEHMGCKVLLTSRSRRVLIKMNTKKDYDIGALKEDEAWRLFEEKAMVKNPTLLAIGKEIAKRCAGWPIVIVTTAASLAKRTDLGSWNNALAKVKKMNSKNMDNIVDSIIESISYDCLSETHKRLFRLCGLLQGDAHLEDILLYSLGWDLLAEDEIVTVEDARNSLQTLIIDLKESCLLLGGDVSNYIKMHDVVRDIAISIAERDHNVFSAGHNTDTDLCRWPKNDVLKKCTAIVFKKCHKLPCFPQRLECPSLELFILSAQSMDSKPKIPDTFFERTSKLKVLDMSGLCFPTLPSTLSFLTNLQSLHLEHCDGLQDISMVGELKTLQVLSLIFSTIQELPSSLSQLSELKLLDLNRCSQLKLIPAGLIASLSQLEELHMIESFDRWESEKCLNNSLRSNASFAELKCLPNLSSLEVQLQDGKLLEKDLNFENLKRYKITVGDMWDQSVCQWLYNPKVKKSIALQLGTNSINHLKNVVDTLFKRTECLCLGELKGINNVIPELSEQGFPELTHLRIVEDSEIRYIVNVEDKQHKPSFPALESLHLSDLRKVEKICNGRLMEGSFYHLTTTDVHDCDSLESLFSFSIIIALPCLQEIKVSNCKSLKQVVAREEGEKETIIFPQLSTISLLDLPNLTTFCLGLVEATTTREKVETVIQPLFDEKVQFPSLKTLFIENLDSIKAIWPNTMGITQSLKKDSSFSETTQINLKDKPQEITIFQNLSEVVILKCVSLKFVFPASVARSLNQLTNMYVSDCGVETIIGDDEDIELEKSEMDSTIFTFPKLVEIELTRLPKMESFYPREHTIEWPALKVLDVVDCGKLYVLDVLRPPGKQGDDRIIKVISRLKRLSIRSKDLPTLLELCDLLQPQLSLEEVTIREFQGELSTFPSKLLNLIHHLLQTFRVCSCSFQKIFPYEGDVTDHVNDDALFPQLRKLELEKLPELEYICKQDQYSSFIQNILNRLEDLHVTECSRLTNLVPPSVSFRLLKVLRISDCCGLVNLLQPSTTRSLEQLERLDISGCEMIEEIIRGEVRDDDEESSSSCREDEIIFNKLWYFKLMKLPRLTSFYSSRNYTFNFPKLRLVYVVECPNMKAFCGGITTTPKLKGVISTSFSSEERWEGELNTTIEKIYEREAERLTITIPSILATKHSAAEAQEERVAGTYTCDKSKGKEVGVSKQGLEHFENSKTPRFSDPSCSNYTASSSQLSPQISNHPHEVCHLPTQVEAHTPAAIVWTTSSSNQFEEQAQVHDMSPEKSTIEPSKEGHISRNDIEELGDKAEICKNATKPEKESEVCENVIRQRRENDICEKVVEITKEVNVSVKEAQRLVTTHPSTSSNGQFEPEAESHKTSIEELLEPTKESQISKHVIDYELGTGTSLAAPSSQPKNFPGLRVAKDFSQSLSDFLQILETQPLKSMNEEQFQAMEDAFRTLSNINFSADLLSPYVHEARKCMERKRKVSELELKIAEAEERVRAMKEEKKVLEEEYEAIPL